MLVHCTKAKIQQFTLEYIQYLWRGWATVSENDVLHTLDIDALRLRMNDGRKFSLDTSWEKNNRSERNTICNTIERDFVRCRLPVLLEQYNRGERIDFPSGPIPFQYKSGSTLPSGSLSISNTSVSSNRETLTWDMIERFRVGEDLIQIRKRGRRLDWYNYRIPDMANACLLRELVQMTFGSFS
jgi:hypothetical protein